MNVNDLLRISKSDIYTLNLTLDLFENLDHYGLKMTKFSRPL